MPCDTQWPDEQVDLLRRWMAPGDSGRESTPAVNHHHPVRTAHLGGGDLGVRATAPPGSGRRRSEMKLVVNGAEVEVDDRHAKTPLLWVLRDVLGLHGTKFGCGAGFCAACTVLIDGRNTKSCQTDDRAGGRQGRHDGRGSLWSGGRRRSRRLAPRQRRAVRLLPARADAGRGVAARVRPVARRRKDRRVDERQPVPLRHLSADPGGHSRGRRHARRGRVLRLRSSLRPSSR